MYAMAYTETAAPEPMLLKNVLERLPGAELVWDKESEEHWFIDLETRKKIWLPTRKVSLLYDIYLLSLFLIDLYTHI